MGRTAFMAAPAALSPFSALRGESKSPTSPYFVADRVAFRREATGIPPDSRAAQSTVLLATLSTGFGAEPRGCAGPETLGDGICNASTVVCERVAKRFFLKYYLFD